MKRLMFPRALGRFPVNIKLGSQRAKVGYIDHMPDGSYILIPRIPETGFHVSLHPNMIHISDNQGLDLGFDFLSLENERELVLEFAGYIEELVDSIEVNPEFDEDLMAFPDPEARFARLCRRSKYGIDVDVLGALRSQGLGLPMFVVEEEAAPAYLESYGDRAGFLFGVESHRAYMVPQPSSVVGFDLDLEDMGSIADQIPFGQRVIDTFSLIGQHMHTLEAGDFSPFALLEEEFRSLDTGRLERDLEPILAGFQPPYMKRFTKDGFVPVDTL